MYAKRKVTDKGFKQEEYSQYGRQSMWVSPQSVAGPVEYFKRTGVEYFNISHFTLIA